MRERMRSLMPEDDFPCNAFYGDGTPIEESDLAALRKIIAEETVTFIWQQEDVLICDNYLVSHGREAFEGERQVYVAIG